MILLKTAEEMKHTAHHCGKKIAFVPTMGALHEGHLALMREARRYGDLVVVSIFVNPTQFNDPEDYRKYPRVLNDDLKKCEEAGVDLVFAPTPEVMYPPNDTTPAIPVPQVGETLEGALRPGHFQGVVTIVYKLFQIVRPQAALFGLKDFQQVRVIQEMVKEQKLSVLIVPYPIVRSPEGLALSSRNQRLSEKGKVTALKLSQALNATEAFFRNGERSASLLRNEALRVLKSPDIKVDEVQIVDAETLEPLTTLERPALLALACFIENVRLIDNRLLKEDM